MQDGTPQQQTDMLGLSIVIPCFNEEPVLAELDRRCCESAALAVGDSFELILVDKGSSDGARYVITRQIARHPNIVAIKLSRNCERQIGRFYLSTKKRPLFIIDSVERSSGQ